MTSRKDRLGANQTDNLTAKDDESLPNKWIVEDQRNQPQEGFQQMNEGACRGK